MMTITKSQRKLKDDLVQLMINDIDYYTLRSLIYHF